MEIAPGLRPPAATCATGAPSSSARLPELKAGSTVRYSSDVTMMLVVPPGISSGDPGASE